MSQQPTKPQSEKQSSVNLLQQAQVFDQAHVRRAFDRAAESYEQFAVLQNEVCNRLLEKLDIVKLQPHFPDHTGNRGWHLHGRLVGLDLNQILFQLYDVSLADEDAQHVARFDVLAQFGQLDLVCHGSVSFSLQGRAPRHESSGCLRPAITR